MTLRSDINFLVTNIVPPKWLKQTNLKLSKKGFIQVNNFLQNEDFKHIFASGDIADLKGFLVPKSGVYAVRQGNILSYNLRNFLTGGKLKKYYPQKKSLSLLGNGFDFAFFSFGNLTISGYLPWILKNYIDRKYVNKYNKLF